MFRKFRVTGIIQESKTIKSFYLKKVNAQPVEGYLAGQFVSVRIRFEGRVIIRNYTLSDSPGNAYFRLTIKREEFGESSRYFHDVLKEEDTIEVSEPMGNFHLDNASNSPVVLISGGVGITPMLSMMEYAVLNRSNRKIYCLHSSSNKSVQPMSDRLQELARSHENIALSIFHSNPEANEVKGSDYDIVGHITKEHLEKVIQSNMEFYLCGPATFMEAIYTHLQSLGVANEHIHYEFFGEGKVLGSKPVFKDSTNNTIKVNFKNSEKELLWDNSYTNILELAEANGLTPEFSCRMGTCSTCETTLVKGQITYNPEPFMEPEDGKVYICCSIPTEDVELSL